MSFLNKILAILFQRQRSVHDFLMMLTCVCVCLSLSTVKASSVWISWDTREQINDVVLKTLDSSSGSLHRFFGMQSLTFQLAARSCSYTRSEHSHDSTSIRLAFRTQDLHSPLTDVAFGTHYTVSRSAFASALTRGFEIYLGKAKVITNFRIESSPRQSTQPSPSSFISASENVTFYLQRRNSRPLKTGEKRQDIMCSTKR